MPKEKPGVSEHSLCATSSKNAKDKSNSTTLLAIRNTKEADKSSGWGFSSNSEKDSGYSDGSDWQQTDAEDQQSDKSQSRVKEVPSTSHPGLKHNVAQGNAGNPTLMPGGGEMARIHLNKNMVLKQPEVIQKRVPLPRKSRVSSSTGAAHIILLPQPSVLLATLQLHKSQPQRRNSPGKKVNGTYLPILNSYPRIAPHPSKKPPDKSSPNDESQNLSKRVCTEQKNDEAPVTSSLPDHHLYHQPKLAGLTSRSQSLSSARSSLTSSPCPVSSSQGSPSGSSLHTSSSSVSTRGPNKNSSSNTRHRRFLNTVEILKQSGLLGITLRTKELQRQSNAAERDIAQLRQHTELLCQVASDPSGDLNGIPAWQHLHRYMAESGNYPYLKRQQDLQMPCFPDSANKPEFHLFSSEANSEGPPSKILTTVTDPNHNCPVPLKSHSGREQELQDEKDAFMPPDSSTD